MRVIGLLVVLIGCTTAEWVREYRRLLPGTGRYEAAVFLVRDKWTGQPIEGALVRQHEEWLVDWNGRWAPLVAEARTDEFGLVAFDLPEHPGSCHWTIDAPGYAPTEEYGGLVHPVVDMEPGWEQAGRLLGPQGQPLANVEVEYKTGCAHAPALRTTRTDADGVFVLENVQSGDITFEDPRFAADYWGGVRARPRRWGIACYQVLPGGTVRGRVIRSDGTPPGWAAVHSDTSGRGPRTVVDEKGHFVLCGVRLSARLFIHTEDAVPTVEMKEYRPGGPILIRLGGEDVTDGAQESVRVFLVDAGRKQPDKLCEVFLDRVVDGRRFCAEWSPWQDGPTEMCVERGDYLLSVGEPWSGYVAAPRELSVSGPTEITVTVHRQPKLDVDLPSLEGDPLDETRVLLTDRCWTVELGDPEYPVYVPAKAKAWLRVDLGRVPHTFPIGPAHHGVRHVAVRLPGSKRIVFPELEGNYDAYLLYGEEAEVELTASEEWENSRTLATYAFGNHWLVVRHERMGRAVAAIDLPWSAADPIEVRGLVFEPLPEAAELRVLGPDGSPVPGAYVEVSDDGSPPGYYWSWTGEEQTDERGVYRDSSLRDGTHVRVEVDGFLPCWERLQGEAPYVVRLGYASVELDLRAHPEARVVFDGHAWLKPDQDGKLVLRGIRAGQHNLLVGANGHVGLVYRLFLNEGEVRRLRPELRAR